MSFVNIWVHSVWSTKNKEPLLSKSIRFKVFTHIREKAVEEGIHIDFINGVEDHIHCLISLSAVHSISEAINIIKGESSNWINNSSLIKGQFEWQDEYYSVSVSPHEIPRIRNYIRNQETHHLRVNFEDEKINYFGVKTKKIN